MNKSNIRTKYPSAEAYMQSCMTDSAHDMEHVYRVTKYALNIARYENECDLELLTIACLLHDIGRAEQFADPSVDHAICGSEKAYKWLKSNGYSDNFAISAKSCIQTHRFRSDNPPKSIEAKILFDADKLNVCGAMGIARTILYKAHVSEPLYSLNANYEISDGTNDNEPSFMQEYKFKLENIYGKFYTKRGLELAAKRRIAADNFYHSLLSEVRECYSVSVDKQTFYNKLIRDNIPEIIKASGKTPVIMTLDDDEYLNALNQKLQEEVFEYMDSKCLDELCDILEVVYAIAKTNGYSLEEIENCRKSKRIKNGAFENRLYLEKVVSEGAE